MSILDFFKPSTNVLHTKYGDFNLAKKKDIQKLKGVIISLQRTTDALTRKDLRDWRQAWQMAINIDYPNRQRLYDIYRDVDVDLHLTGCVNQRSGFVLAQSFKFVNPDGTDNEDVMPIFDSEWFKNLLRYALQATYWGHSLIELGDVVNNGGIMAYAHVALLPRKHVIPEYHRIITDLSQDWTTGIDYHEQPFADWLIEVGQPEDLGIFLKAAIQTIPKKNALSFWDTFAEIFGMPWRVAKTTSRDEKEIKSISQQLNDMANAATAVVPADADIQIVESAKGDAFNVYDRRIDRANSELSKLVIGQTMTIEDGSSLSQSITHFNVFRMLIEADCDRLRDIINGQLLPRMVKHGFPLKGLRFEWNYPANYTPEQQVAFETMVLNNYEVDPTYFTDKYKMPVGERRSFQMPANSNDENNDEEEQNENENSTEQQDNDTQHNGSDEKKNSKTHQLNNSKTPNSKFVIPNSKAPFFD